MAKQKAPPKKRSRTSAPPPIGRPTLYTPELADAICDFIATGKSLRSIGAMEGMPSDVSIRKWLADRPDFLAQYARAREQSADFLAEEIVEISDRKDLDPNDKRVRVEARKWVAAKLKPKSYGEKVEHNVTGELAIVRAMSDAEIEARVAKLLAKRSQEEGRDAGPAASGD